MARLARTGMLVMSLVLVASSGTASAAVCDDAANCAISGAAASCRAFAVLSTSPAGSVSPAEAHVITPPGNNSDNVHVARQDIRPAFPSMTVHVGAVESFCQSLTTDSGVRKACGRATMQDVYIDLNPVVRATVRAWNLVSSSCSSAGPGTEAFNESHIERLVVSEGSVVYPFSVAAHNPNTVISLGPGTRVIVNEQNPVFSSCNSSTGSMLHIETPSGDLIVGWVSTSACP